MDRLDCMLSGHTHTQAEELNVSVVVCLSHEKLFQYTFHLFAVLLN